MQLQDFFELAKYKYTYVLYILILACVIPFSIFVTLMLMYTTDKLMKKWSSKWENE